MIDSLGFYIALYIILSPVILAVALSISGVMMIPVYLIDTRKD